MQIAVFWGARQRDCFVEIERERHESQTLALRQAPHQLSARRSRQNRALSASGRPLASTPCDATDTSVITTLFVAMVLLNPQGSFDASTQPDTARELLRLPATFLFTPELDNIYHSFMVQYARTSDSEDFKSRARCYVMSSRRTFRVVCFLFVCFLETTDCSRLIMTFPVGLFLFASISELSIFVAGWGHVPV